MYSESSRFQFGTLRGTIGTVKLYNSIQLPTYFFLTERIVYFLNTVHCHNILKEYYYEIQLHKALYDFTVETGYCWFKESLPPQHIRE